MDSTWTRNMVCLPSDAPLLLSCIFHTQDIFIIFIIHDGYLHSTKATPKTFPRGCSNSRCGIPHRCAPESILLKPDPTSWRKIDCVTEAIIGHLRHGHATSTTNPPFATSEGGIDTCVNTAGGGAQQPTTILLLDPSPRQRVDTNTKIVITPGRAKR